MLSFITYHGEMFFLWIIESAFKPVLFLKRMYDEKNIGLTHTLTSKILSI